LNDQCEKLADLNIYVQVLKSNR